MTAGIVDHCGGFIQLQAPDGRVLATATKCRKSEGFAFSGWVIRSETDRYLYSDPIPTKAEVLKHIHEFSGE